MKRVLAMLVGCCVLLGASAAHAACYSGSNWKKDGNTIYVCLKGEESWANRHKAEGLCAQITGRKCDAVSTYSSSCGNGNCYDEARKKHNNLSGY